MATVSCHLRLGTPGQCGARVRGQSDSVVPRTAASGEISSCDHTTWNHGDIIYGGPVVRNDD